MRVHQVFVVATAFCLLSGASPPSLVQSPEHVVIDYLAAWNMHDAPRAAGHLAYDVAYFEPSDGQTVSGRDATRTAMLARFLNTAPDAIWMLRGDNLVDGDKVAVEWEFTGTNTGMLPNGSPPTGKHMVLQGMSVFRVLDGMIVYQADYFDPAQALKTFETM